MVALWGSLQSQFFKNWSPKTTILTERILFTVLPIISPPLILSGIVQYNGIQNSPYYLSILMCILCYLFEVPCQSSFKVPRFGEKLASIQKPIESKIHIILAFILPFFYYILLFKSSFLQSQHIINILTVVSIPLFIFSFYPEGFLWFLYDSDHHYKWKIFFQFLSMISIFTWIEFHVIFERYSYLLIIPAPYSYILITLCLYTFAGIIIIHNRYLSIILSIICSVAGSLALGFPYIFIPFVAIAAYTGTSFIYSKSQREYLIFGSISTVIGIWWLKKSFSFLDYQFQFKLLPVEWTISMEHSVYIIGLLFILCLLTVSFSNYPNLFSTFLTFTSILLSLLEQILYEQGEGFYPASLVILTTILGVYLCNSLFQKNRIGLNGATILISIFISKLGIFLIPIRMVLIASFFTSLTITRLYLSTHVKPIVGWFYVLFSGISLFSFQNILLKPIIQYIEPNASYSRVLGFVLFVWGLTILPLSYKFMKHIKLLRRINIFLIVIGAVWSFLQPNISTSEWIPWINLFVIIIVLLNVLNIIQLPNNTITRIIYFTFVGVGSALGFSSSWIYGFHTTILICIIFTLASYVLYTAHYPLFTGYKLCIAIYGIFMTMFPITYFTTTQKFEILSLYTVLNIFLVVIIKFKLSGSPLLNSKKSDTGISIPASDELAIVSNTGTIISYLLAVFLTILTDPKPFTFILLSSLFILLNRDSQLFSEFLEPMRYIIVMVAIQISLLGFFIKSILQLFVDFDQNIHELITQGILFITMIPSHVLIDVFLWKLKRPVVYRVILASIPCFFTILMMSKFESLFWFGIIGVFGSILEIFTATQWSRQVSFPL